MRYIRFLKTPRLVPSKDPSKSSLSFLITITSDLGDSFLSCDVGLLAELFAFPSGQPLLAKPVQWTAGMRSLSVALVLDSSRDYGSMRVRVGVGRNMGADEYSRLSWIGGAGVVSAWTAPFGLGKECLKLVERQFVSSGWREVRIWEETGESIARHLWDAGITLSCHLNELVDTKTDHSLAKVLHVPEGKERLQVLELGTGCGMVGITIAQGIPQADVVLTDLPEAEEIVQKNMDQATVAKDSTLKFKTLDWNDQIPKDLSSWSECPHYTALDLIIAADCTYNPDSSPGFVQTITRLAQTSPNAVIVVAMKMRHSSEEVFFELMSEAGFATTESLPFPLPGDEEEGEETVYVHIYRHKAGDRSVKADPNESCLAR